MLTRNIHRIGFSKLCKINKQLRELDYFLIFELLSDIGGSSTFINDYHFGTFAFADAKHILAEDNDYHRKDY